MSDNARRRTVIPKGNVPQKRARINSDDGPSKNTRSKFKMSLEENKENIEANKREIEVLNVKKIDKKPLSLPVPNNLDREKELNSKINKEKPCCCNLGAGSSRKTVSSNLNIGKPYLLRKKCASSTKLLINTEIINSILTHNLNNNNTNLKKLVPRLQDPTKDPNKFKKEPEKLNEIKIQKFLKEDKTAEGDKCSTIQLKNEKFKETNKKVTFPNEQVYNDSETLEWHDFNLVRIHKVGSSAQAVILSEKLEEKIRTSTITSPFKERGNCPNIINDGVPSLKKKTLKKYLNKSSGHQGVIDMDPNMNSVHPNILYGDNLRDIMRILLATEKKCVLPANFVKKITKILKPRAMLVNWLLKIQQYFKSDDGVFFISVRIFDRLLQITDISKDQVQLVGIVSYWIVMKFCDIVATPLAPELASLCRNEITKAEILTTEQKILSFLEFHITKDEPMIWVRYYIYEMKLDNCHVVASCANYLLDCFTLNASSGTYLLSLQAAASVCLSLELLEQDPECWESIKHVPGYHSLQDVIPLRRKMFNMFQQIQDPEYEFREPFLKYMNKKYGAISVKLLKKQIAT